MVLLIDEIDKTDQEFEAMLLEVLSDFQVSIPELGVVEAKTHPIVLLTSNNSRELTEALKRRCLYLWLDYPDVERELEIVRLHAPELSEEMARKLVEVVHMVRNLDLKKPPSIAESIDWARALLLLGAEDIDGEMLQRTMSVIVKHRTDLDLVAERVGVKLTDGLIGRHGRVTPSSTAACRRAAGPAGHGAAAAGVRRRAAQRGHGRGHLRAARLASRALEAVSWTDRERLPRGAVGHARQVARRTGACWSWCSTASSSARSSARRWTAASREGELSRGRRRADGPRRAARGDPRGAARPRGRPTASCATWPGWRSPPSGARARARA